MATFDPVSSFQAGRRGALQIQAAEQDVARERTAAPIRNQLAELQLGQAQVGAQRGETQFGQQQALQRMTIFGQAARALRGLPLEQRDAAFTAIEPELEKFGIPAGTFAAGTFTDENLDRAIAQSQAFAADPAKASADFTLSQGQQRFGPGGELIAEVAPRPTATTQTPAVREQAVIPPSLIADLPSNLAQQASDAFTVAGGGTDGLKAAAQIIDKGSEQQRRLISPQIIQTSFPKASSAELIQLQSAMDSAKTTESGLKEAGKVRTEQRRLKKAQVFQNRAIELLDNILSNEELNDVLGSVEGTDAGFLFGEKIRSDREAEAIADIQETESLLTADNLSLMTGVLSETDIKIIRQLAAGALIRTRGEARFIKDVTSLKDRLSSQLVQTADDTATDRQGGAQQLPATPPSGRQGGQLMTDAQGNRAFVFPDGTFEEVQ